MKRKDFIKFSGLTVAGAMLFPTLLLGNSEKNLNLCEETKRLLEAFSCKPSIEEIKEIDKLIREFKQRGIWDKIDYYYRMDVGGPEDRFINWKNPIKR